MVAGGDWEEADRGDDAGVAQLWLSGDDGVGYVVVDCLSVTHIISILPCILFQLCGIAGNEKEMEDVRSRRTE